MSGSSRFCSTSIQDLHVCQPKITEYEVQKAGSDPKEDLGFNCYWWPVGFTEHVTAKCRPIRVKLLGEDLVLFRDGSGKLGILGLHCSHHSVLLS
jgi:phenylpropionate dioxygenase-like ring-hydroxylating dioxygenase large terminal subunit